MQRKLKKTSVNRPREKKIFFVPNLFKDAESKPFIIAALNGLIDFDDLEKNILCLKTLLAKTQLNTSARTNIILFLLQQEQVNHYFIPQRYQVIKFLVEHGADPRLPLLSEIPCLPLEVLKALIDGGGDVNTNFNGYSALHVAVIAPDHVSWQKRLKFLLARGADPNIKETAQGFGTALHMLIANEGMFNDKTWHARAKYLIPILKKYNYDWNSRDAEGKTVLILAAKMRATQVLQLLLAQRKEFNLSLDLDIQDEQGRTALHFCCALGNVEGVKALLAAGACKSSLDKQGRTPFAYTKLTERAVRHILTEIHIDPDRDEEAVLNHIIGVDGIPFHWQVKGETVVLAAVKETVEHMFPLIIAEVKKLTHAEVREYAIDYITLQCGHLTGKSLIKACLQGQSLVRDVLNTIKKSSSLLSSPSCLFPADNALTDLLDKVIHDVEHHPDHQFFLDSVNNNDFSAALRQACHKGCDYLVEILLNYLGSQSKTKLINCINTTCENGKSALHWAAIAASESGDKRILEMLLRYDIDTTLRDKEDKLYSDYLRPMAGLKK